MSIHAPFAMAAKALRITAMVLGLCLTLAWSAQPKPDGPQSAAPGVVPASRFAKNVAVITIRGPISSQTAVSVSRRIDAATAAGADALVFEIHSPGGELGAVLEITSAIRRAKIANTVAWINNQAYSGGAIVAIACRQMVTAKGAAFGDAAPVVPNMDPRDKNPLRNLNPTERAKILAPLLAEVVRSARLNGYDEKLVQAMVMLGAELWLVEDISDPTRRVMIDRAEYRLLFGSEPPLGTPRLASGASPTRATPSTTPLPAPDKAPPAPGAGPDGTGFIPAAPANDSLVRDVNMGLDTVSTRPVLTAADKGKWKLLEYVTDGQILAILSDDELLAYRFAVDRVENDEELKQFFGASNLIRLNPSWSEVLAQVMSNFYVRGVLFVIFLLGLFIEMTHPGLIAPGTVAAAALVLLLAPPMLIGMASWWEVAAILLGITLIGLEIFVMPGFGVPGIAGLLLLFGGLLGTFVPTGQGLFPDSVEGQQGLMYGVATLAVSTVTAMVLMYFVAKHFGRLPVVGALILRDPTPNDDDGMLAAMGGGPADSPVALGQVGVAVTPLRPSGRVEVSGRVIDVVAEVGYIAAGATVRVTAVGDFRTTVEEVKGTG